MSDINLLANETNNQSKIIQTILVQTSNQRSEGYDYHELNKFKKLKMYVASIGFILNISNINVLQGRSTRNGIGKKNQLINSRMKMRERKIKQEMVE